MDSKFEDLLRQLPKYEQVIGDSIDSILSNLVMINEIPAPTFKERDRCTFLINRFTESDLLNCSTDETGNALGILPGTVGERNILIVAHMDTLFSEDADHTVTVSPQTVRGVSVADNSLGVAVMAALPTILKALKIKLQSNIILMGSSRSLGRGNIEGLRFFLDNFIGGSIDAGICVEGVQLGRLSYKSIGMIRGEINYNMPTEYNTAFGTGGAIITLNEVINKILEIPLPRHPKTSIVLGSIGAGRSFNTGAAEAFLRFEVRSESGDMVDQLRRRIGFIVDEIASEHDAEFMFDILAKRQPGGLPFDHPLVASCREIIKSLGIKLRLSPSTSELSAFIAKGIPALTIGMTNGENNAGSKSEVVEIEYIKKGVAQLVGLITAMDKGFCDES